MLKDIAIAASQQSEAKDEERRAEDERREKERALNYLKGWASNVFPQPFTVTTDPDTGHVMIDDLEFSTWRDGYSYNVHLYFPCPKCGKTTWAQVWDLASVGWQLRYPDPDYGSHNCPFRQGYDNSEETHTPAPVKAPEPTLAEQLADLIRKIVREETQEA